MDSIIAYADQVNHTFVDYNSEFKDNREIFPTFCPIIEIHISCQNLVNLDVGSKSDPFCVLFTKQNGKYIETERTEVILSNQDPHFVKSFKTYFMYELNQPLRFEVYDSDSHRMGLSNHDFIGYYETDVRHLATNLDQSLTFELINDKKKGERGQIIITPEQTKESIVHLQGQIQVNNLPKMKTFAKNNPFYEICKVRKGKEIPIFRSNIRKKCFSCTYRKFIIPLHLLYTDGLDDTISISFYDSRKKKEPKLIGQFSSSIGYFIQTTHQHFELKNGPQKKTAGEFWFNYCQVVNIPTFANYLQSGLTLKMMTAIDYTESNGYQCHPNSNHYISKDQTWMNPYQRCIMTVGAVLSKFDKDQKFPVYGFGGKIDHETNFCFPLTFDNNNPCVNGLQGIFDAYKASFEKVKLSSPTYFEKIIKTATQAAIQNFQKSKTYTVLLIITDGDVDDMQKTIDAIVEASDAPLSVIIIGVGNWGFKDMYKLDADEVELVSSNGRIMKRDFVQFVPFRNIMNAGIGNMEVEVLKELPLQIHEYCSSHGFIPKV